MRRQGTVVAVAALLWLGAQTASGQQSTASGQQNQTSGQQSGVVKPRTVDPGMTKPAPALPPGSTPVIHPRTRRRGRDGPVQVEPR